jgi:hypothetical protein
MAYDEKLADRVRALLKGKRGLREIRMFGGLCFMVNDQMCCGVARDDLMVRVLPERYEILLEKPHARVMDFTGRPLSGFVFVGPGGYRSEPGLKYWVEEALSRASAPPGKHGGRRGAKNRKPGSTAPGAGAGAAWDVASAGAGKAFRVRKR